MQSRIILNPPAGRGRYSQAQRVIQQYRKGILTTVLPLGPAAIGAESDE